MFQTTKSPEARTLTLSLILLVGAAAALRLYALDRWSLWLDETIQYFCASLPLHQLYAALDPYAMPLTLQLGHGLIPLELDRDVWQLRLPAAILGAGSVGLVFLLARELLGQRAASFCGLVMPVLVVYSQEYRNYSFLIFLTALSGWSLATQRGPIAQIGGVCSSDPRS